VRRPKGSYPTGITKQPAAQIKKKSSLAHLTDDQICEEFGLNYHRKDESTGRVLTEEEEDARLAYLLGPKVKTEPGLFDPLEINEANEVHDSMTPRSAKKSRGSNKSAEYPTPAMNFGNNDGFLLEPKEEVNN
jgi:hypothetical protein